MDRLVPDPVPLTLLAMNAMTCVLAKMEPFATPSTARVSVSLVSSERIVKTLVLKGVTGTTVPTNALARMAATARTRTVNVRARPDGRVCFASCRAELVFSEKDARILARARTAHLVTTSREHARAAPDIEDPLVTPLALKGDSGWIANRLAIAKRTTPSSAMWKRELANAKLISEVSGAKRCAKRALTERIVVTRAVVKITARATRQRVPASATAAGSASFVRNLVLMASTDGDAFSAVLLASTVMAGVIQLMDSVAVFRAIEAHGVKSLVRKAFMDRIAKASATASSEPNAIT